MNKEKINIEERIANLVSDSDDIPSQLTQIPEKYRKLSIHTEGSFVVKYCISKELEEKLRNIINELYCRDFVYEIKRIANISQEEDKLTEERIELRYEDIENKEKGITCYELSYFTIDVFNFVKMIENKVGIKLNSIYDISKYQEIVKEELSKIEKNLSKEILDIKKVKKNDRIFYVITINNMHFDVLTVPNKKKDIFTVKPTYSSVKKTLKKS